MVSFRQFVVGPKNGTYILVVVVGLHIYLVRSEGEKCERGLSNKVGASSETCTARHIRDAPLDIKGGG